MNPQRPTLRECASLTGTIISQGAGLAGQCLRVAGVETTVTTGRQLSRFAKAIGTIRAALDACFGYTAAKPKQAKAAAAADFVKV